MAIASISCAPARGKQREILLRDVLFLDIAQEILLEEGYHALTMGRIAEATQFSKGTVYNRFTCKEELVVALGCRCWEQRMALLERGAGYAGRPRERLVALGEAAEHFARLYPESVRVLHLIDAQSILEKVPEAARERMKSYGLRLFGLLLDLVRDAAACGDLVLPRRTPPEELCFALCALVEGGAGLVMGGLPTAERGMPDPYGAIGRGCHLLMDGAGWHPLSSEQDYSETARQVRAALFAEEGMQLESQARSAGALRRMDA